MVWPRLDSFEASPDFPSCLEEAIGELRVSIRRGFEKHGDGFASNGLPAFATHCERKAREKRDKVLFPREGVVWEEGEGPEQLSLELATYALLERVYWIMLGRR